MNFFKSKQRSPADLVRSAREGVSKLDSGPVEARKRVRAASCVLSITRCRIQRSSHTNESNVPLSAPINSCGLLATNTFYQLDVHDRSHNGSCPV
jgi:hypothetical protein